MKLRLSTGRRVARALGALSSCAALGCASIVSKSDWPVVLDSTPSGAEITVTNRSGVTVFKGRTPTTLTLSSKAGYFSGAAYSVEASLNGYESGRATLDSRLNGWYVGNLLFSGLIGFLIVDPLTGAMWKLDDRMVVNLGVKNSSLEPPAPGEVQVRVVTLDQIPPEQRAHLIPIR